MCPAFHARYRPIAYDISPPEWVITLRRWRDVVVTILKKGGSLIRCTPRVREEHVHRLRRLHNNCWMSATAQLSSILRVGLQVSCAKIRPLSRAPPRRHRLGRREERSSDAASDAAQPLLVKPRRQETRSVVVACKQYGPWPATIQWTTQIIYTVTLHAPETVHTRQKLQRSHRPRRACGGCTLTTDAEHPNKNNSVAHRASRPAQTFSHTSIHTGLDSAIDAYKRFLRVTFSSRKSLSSRRRISSLCETSFKPFFRASFLNFLRAFDRDAA
jgi:hypothetical protein